MLKTLGVLSIFPMLSLAFFIPFSVSFSNENKDSVTNGVSNSSSVFLHSSNGDSNETFSSVYEDAKICPFITYVDKELCNSSITEVNINHKEIVGGVDIIKLNITPKDLCPLLQLVDKTFCNSTQYSGKMEMNTSRTKDEENENEGIDPKDLCPILEILDGKLCS